MIKIFFHALGVLTKLGAVKNWKTTAIGLIGAVAMVVFDLMNAGVVDWQTYVKSALVAIAAILAKDADATGGSKEVITSETIPVAKPTNKDIRDKEAKDTSMEG